MRSYCTVPGCSGVAHGWELCQTHYYRMRRRGTLVALPQLSAMERFAERRDVHGPLPENHPEFGNCWLSTFHAGRGGYCAFSLGKKTVKAHRFALEQAMGRPIPEGLDALHTCDVPSCVRNDEVGTYELNGETYPRWGHLWLGTTRDNTADRDAKGHNGLLREPHRAARGEAAGKHKLTTEQVRTIREQYLQGGTQSGLARKYGVGNTSIRNIVHRISWRHV